MGFFDDYEDETIKNDKANNEVIDESTEEERPTDTSEETASPAKQKSEEKDSTLVPEMSAEKTEPTQEQNNTDTATFIDKDCIIEGNIKTSKDVTIAGTVNGSVQTSGNVTVLRDGYVKDGMSGASTLLAEGNVGGNISAGVINISPDVRIHGDLKASGDIVIKDGSVVIGAVSGENVTISGAVKGDIVAKEKVDLKESAIVKGSVSASALNICPGAVLDGACNLTNKKCDYKAIFGE